MRGIFSQELMIGGDGPRVAVKDTIDIAGYPTKAGSRIFADVPPAVRHADVVQLVLDAGCRIVGKTNLHELAYGVTGINHWAGTPPNPRYPGLIPGGSSSGSAASVAAGLADFALGTDTGGSIRIPAACCGIYGFKPTFGRVSRRGIAPERTSLDCVGPFADDLDMIERAMSIIDGTYRPVEAPATLVLGVVEVKPDTIVSTALSAALASPKIDLVTVNLSGLQKAFEAGLTIIGRETWEAFGRYAESPALGADVRGRLQAAGAITADRLAAAEIVRREFTAAVDRELERVDALVLPTMPNPPLTLEDALDANAAIHVTSYVRPFNLSGHPALSMPLPGSSGPPVSLQLVGRRGEDAFVCAIARRLLASLNP